MRNQFLTAEWNNLVMANYIIDPAILKPYLPLHTELDFYKGNSYVSLVGFMFENTRIRGFKIPFHINFEEVNLRMYIKYQNDGEWKRGVVFIKEIVPRPAISFIANNLYHEKYSTLPMKHFYSKKENEIQLGYHWKYKNKWNRLEAAAEIEAQPMLPGSEAEFITEHYWGCSKYNAQTTYEKAVQHTAWQVHTVKNHVIDCDFAGLYGTDFAMLQNAPPNSVFMARGSVISILGKKKL
jgi:uncharacterized protein YqjF (DUF2071 family)